MPVLNVFLCVWGGYHVCMNAWGGVDLHGINLCELYLDMCALTKIPI